MDKKVLKKYRSIKRKAVQPWKGLAILFGMLSLIYVMLLTADSSFIPRMAKQVASYNQKQIEEGIYTGYKYYETRYEDYCMERENSGEYRYYEEVNEPFGYDENLQQFSYSDLEIKYDKYKDRFEVYVFVTNIGTTKLANESVQLYIQTPYTEYDQENGIEKPAVTLYATTNTNVLEPDESQDVVIYVDRKDLAVYDAYGAKTHILDAGDYYLTIATDSHDAVNNILAAKGYTVENTDGRMDADGNPELVGTWNEKELVYVTDLDNPKEFMTDKKSDTNVIKLTRKNWMEAFTEASEQIAERKIRFILLFIGIVFLGLFILSFILYIWKEIKFMNSGLYHYYKKESRTKTGKTS